MEMIADIMLAAGAIGAAFYCLVLGRRLKRFNNLEKGVGGAVAVLSAQVDDLTKTLTSAQGTAAQSAETLTELAKRAEDISRTLELQMASLRDVESVPVKPTPAMATAAPAPAQTPSGEPMFVRRSASGAV